MKAKGKFLAEAISAKEEESKTFTFKDLCITIIFLPFFMLFWLMRTIPSVLLRCVQAVNGIMIFSISCISLGVEKIFYRNAYELSCEQKKKAHTMATILLSVILMVLLVCLMGWLWGILAYIFLNNLIKTGERVYKYRNINKDDFANGENDTEND